MAPDMPRSGPPAAAGCYAAPLMIKRPK